MLAVAEGAVVARRAARDAAKAARGAAEAALSETRHAFDAPAAERGWGRLLLQPLLPGELVARLRCAAADEAFGLERGLGGTTLAHGPGPPGAVKRP